MVSHFTCLDLNIRYEDVPEFYDGRRGRTRDTQRSLEESLPQDPGEAWLQTRLDHAQAESLS